MKKKYCVSMEISGNTAMWTRPDTGDSPVSYPAPTYSAVQAIFRSVLWGPAVDIIPERVEICSPVQYHNYTTNYGGPLRSAELVSGRRAGNNFQLIATVLIDVRYKLYAYIIPNRHKDKLDARAKSWDSRTTSPGHAYMDIFMRRLNRGQCFTIPVLGWNEFVPNYFGPIRDEANTIRNMPTISLPSMFREIKYGEAYGDLEFLYDQNVVIENGCLRYPSRER